MAERAENAEEGKDWSGVNPDINAINAFKKAMIDFSEKAFIENEVDKGLNQIRSRAIPFNIVISNISGEIYSKMHSVLPKINSIDLDYIMNKQADIMTASGYNKIFSRKIDYTIRELVINHLDKYSVIEKPDKIGMEAYLQNFEKREMIKIFDGNIRKVLKRRGLSDNFIDLIYNDLVKESEKDIPSEAPEKWINRHPADANPGWFIKRVYGKWIGRGFHTGHIRELDGGLETAYVKWMKAGAPNAPEGFHLPTKAEVIAAESAAGPGTLEARRFADRERQRARRARRVAGGDRER